ncbi:MAG: hypothetical protein CL487_06135 [Acidobacteria bacterium]|uniref:Polymer-forming cytoskeletal protein n=1 Tax=marine metagenome TaxID=408172 RepID=A0A381QTD2_9ZZZZ|nr:hypothetical protein [Acidobacteriota bacterium]|tara:strand:+ start:215 stop:664 length:450 start_codon:yes stop_codon:yes gene_type:complete
MPRKHLESNVARFEPPATLPLDTPKAEMVTSVGETVTIKGELHAHEHVIINGTFEGTISAPDHGVAIGPHGSIEGRIFAKTITVLGRVIGTLTVGRLAELRRTAQVQGELIATDVVMDDGALLQGSIDTSKPDIAMRVARYRADRDNPA